MTVQTKITSAAAEAADVLARLGVAPGLWNDGDRPVRSPISGEVIARVHDSTPADVAAVIDAAHAAFLSWRNVPAPRRGELVRLLGEELRAAKADLGALVTLEAGKVTSESLGEVQEMIDICDLGVGLFRQLYGLTLPSRAPRHPMVQTRRP